MATPWTAVRRRFVHSGTGMAGLVVLIAVIGAAIFAGQFSPYSPIKQDFRIERQPPGLDHLMGTDEFGRDVLSRVIWGAQVSLQAGATAASIALGVGLVLGMLAAYYGGRADNLIMRFMDILLAFPYILLAITVVAILGPGLRNAMIAIAIVYVPHYARVVRGSVLSVRARDYVEAARALGAPDRRIMWQHVLPNTLAPVIVQTTLNVGNAIIDTAGLSFLGLGTQPPTPDWGNMLSAGRNYIIDSPWIATFPGLAILATVLAFNLMGDALRDAFDPRLR
jgi:peptide/nickel transport system permease protein